MGRTKLKQIKWTRHVARIGDMRVGHGSLAGEKWCKNLNGDV